MQLTVKAYGDALSPLPIRVYLVLHASVSFCETQSHGTSYVQITRTVVIATVVITYIGIDTAL